MDPRKPLITKEKAIVIKPPRHVILGRKGKRGNLRDTDVFCDFLVSFCHAAMERCSPNTEGWNKMKFGPEYEHLKCPDVWFERHVDEICGIAEQYIASGRLFGFEICMVTPSNTQLIGFRITLSQMDYSEGCRLRNVYGRFAAILENIRRLKITENLNAMMWSCKYRPRVRLLARIRPESQRKQDNSKAEGGTISRPLADSIPFINNLLCFYSFMI